MTAKLGLLWLSAALSAGAAVSGSVRNGTTGRPQAGAEVTLYRFGAGGMEPVARVQTDAQGNFSFNQDLNGGGPSIVRVEREGVTYNHLLPPGSPSSGFTVMVYDASKQAGDTKVSKHVLLFQPSNGQMVVNETFIVDNGGQTTWFNPAAGTIRFFLPKGASNLDVKGVAPDGSGMAVPVPADVAGRPDIYAAKFEIKPGQSRIDLNYSVPYTPGQPYVGRIVTKDENTYLISPNGITLAGDHLRDLGVEPRTQAHIYGLDAEEYRIQLKGAEVPAATSEANSGAADDNGPGIEQIMPRIYGKAKLILALALGIFALGFILLYRAGSEGAPKESHERGRH